MPRPALVIDARPRGPDGLLAAHHVLGRPLLCHLLEVAIPLAEGPVVIHARFDEHNHIQSLLGESSQRLIVATGPPPEGAAILRTDRIYDPRRLRRSLRRGNDPESAVIWRLDDPLGLAGAEDELVRRQSYQPLGRYWALAPARRVARALKSTRVRPNHLTLASGALVLGTALSVALAGSGLAARVGAALALALALVLDTADGHLARLQGTASDFGRWLDSNIDELGDMALHAAIAWAAFVRDTHVGWLLLGMLYAMGKYLFAVSTGSASRDELIKGSPSAYALPLALSGPMSRSKTRESKTFTVSCDGVCEIVVESGSEAHSSSSHRPGGERDHPNGKSVELLRRWTRLAGHADVRWHLWIVLAALGRLDAALAAYAFYYPARALAGAIRKAGKDA